jgi:hypothetical protein
MKQHEDMNAVWFGLEGTSYTTMPRQPPLPFQLDLVGLIAVVMLTVTRLLSSPQLFYGVVKLFFSEDFPSDQFRFAKAMFCFDKILSKNAAI